MKKFVWLAVILVSMAEAKRDPHAYKLVATYPQLKTCQNNAIIWKDGTRMIYDDGKHATFDKALKHADIQDMFYQPYPRAFRLPGENEDPGRFRNEHFFKYMYGNSASKVRRNLTTVNWFGSTVRVTKINGVNRHLEAVAHELEKYPKYRKYLVPIGGTFKWRKIAGTNRLSVHSFGAAIDINVKYSAYWRWNKGKYRYRNQIPKAIVRAFEKHGFIWGGKWYHYDTMHFEYRPELLGMSSGGGAAHRPVPPTKTAKRRHKKNTLSTSPYQSKTYIVNNGDTLYGIALKFHVRPKALQEANNITDPSKIRVGQPLRIP